MNYETNTLLLVSSSVQRKQLLCFVHDQGQKSEQKHTTKNFDEFHNHSPVLTMVEPGRQNQYHSWLICPLSSPLSAYEVKSNCCLFERLFKVKKNGVFLFGRSFSVLEIFTFL